MNRRITLFLILILQPLAFSLSAASRPPVVSLSKQLPEVTQAMFKTLQGWLKQNVKSHYMPVLNPDYDASRDKLPYPFQDLTSEKLRLKKRTNKI